MEKVCQNCRLLNPANAVFCRHCAASLPVNAQHSGGNPGQYSNQQKGQGQHPNQQWGSPNTSNQMGGNFAPQADKASGRAISSVVLAVTSLLCCGLVTGIPGAILGWMEVTAIKDGRSSPKGMTMAQIGMWGSIIGSIITTIVGFILTVFGGGYGGY